MRAGVAAGLLASALGPAGWAATLEVGPGRTYPVPSAAIAAAHDGDTISIAAGTYFDCAIVGHKGLTIEGEGAGAVLTDKTCADKALLVIEGDGDTIRNLTLARARVPDGNGAGIRLDAPSLHVSHVTFENDQVGLLASSGGGEITIEDSAFHDGGVGGAQPLYAVMVPHAARLLIARTTFAGVAGGQVLTAAARTELIGDQIGAGAGSAPGVAVWVSDGTLGMQGCVITSGPHPLPRDSAIMLMDGAQAELRGNRLVNQTGREMVLLRDWSHATPVLADNVVGPEDELVSSGGIVRHRLSGAAHAVKDTARGMAGRVKRALEHLW